jgi:hypothetical protein
MLLLYFGRYARQNTFANLTYSAINCAFIRIAVSGAMAFDNNALQTNQRCSVVAAIIHTLLDFPQHWESDHGSYFR